MKRFRRILAWIGIFTGAAVAILLLANTYFVWNTGTRLETRLTVLRQAGQPVQLADLARAPIPPETNAQVFLRRAADGLDAIQKELSASYPKQGYPTGDLTPSEQENLEKVFAAYPTVLPLLEQAAECPDSDSQLDMSLRPSQFLEPYMNHSAKYRTAMRVSHARTALLLSSGRDDDALAVQILMLRLTRHWRREPLLIGYLVTAACEQSAMEEVNRVLRRGQVSPATRQALDSELALHDSMEGYTWALQSERAFGLSSFQEFPGSGFWLMRGFTNDISLRVMDLYDRHLNDASLPYTEVVARWKSAPLPAGMPNPYGPLVTLLQPALVAAREPADRVRAMSRSLRVLNALQVHVPPDADRVPDLKDLGLPEETTIDPFNGHPLRVKTTPEGWTVYSVGRNGVDDGGTLDQRTDVGAGPSPP